MNQTVAQTVDSDVLFQLPAPGDRNLAPLLGYDNRQRIRVVGHADRGAMSGSDLAGGDGMRMQRQEAGSRRHAVTLNDDGAVVQLAAMMEDRAQQIA